MKNRSERRLQIDAVMAFWPTAQPTAGFADRVLEECMRPPAQRRKAGARSWLAIAALVAATVALPLFLSRSALPSSPSAAVAAAPLDPDLGPQQD
jgi:hypothetical protein